MQWQEFRSHIRHLPARDIGRIECAFELGKRVHADQKRKSGEPYFSHPIAVAHMLADMGADSDTLIAALLHDTVEDTPLTLAEIDSNFHGSVAAIIDGVTKLGASDIASSPKLDEQTETLRKIFNLMQQDVRIMVIKLVDRLHNMQTAEFLAPERQKTLAQETLEVYVKIADKLCMQDLRDELEALCLAILEPVNYVQLSALRESNEHLGRTISKNMQERLRSHDRLLSARVAMHYEYRTWEQMRAQMSVGDSVSTGLSSVTIVFVCDDIDSCYSTLGALHQLWKREIMSFQDFINAPHLNGYQGLHTTVILEDGTRIRCKIRTKEMQEYARKGIATKSFDSQALGVAEYLPWTKRISPLTTDTEGSSPDFWQSLQRDILGETITIHGPDDTTVQIPKEATALDGVFYLFPDGAFRASAVKVNGVEVSMNKPLKNAASVSITLADHDTCNREWLRNVQTGFAAAKIRTALMQEPREKKLLIGKQMLQEILTERKKGYIEEFDQKSIFAKLSFLGYRSFDEVYIAIADGRVEPLDMYRSIFEKPELSLVSKAHYSTIRYTVDMNAVELMDRVNLVHRSYGEYLDEISYQRRPHGDTFVTLRVKMDTRVLNAFQQALVAAGVKNMRLRQLPQIKHIFIIVLLATLWGIDPIAAKLVMGSGVTATILTMIRAWIVFLFAVMIMLIRRRFTSLVRLPFRYPSLWLSGIALFVMNVLTYAYLRDGSPLLYNSLLRLNAIIIILPLLRYAQWFQAVSVSLLLGMSGVALVISGPFSIAELLHVAIIVIAFNIYTRMTSRFQSEARVQARYMQLFAAISFISACSSLALVPFLGEEHALSLSSFALASGYTVIFVGVPYMIFHAMTDNFGYITISPWLNGMVLMTLIAQPFLLGDTRGFIFLVPATLLLSIASLLAARILRKSE